MFNDWKYGLDNYQLTYHADLLSTDASRVQMRVRYLTREIRYLYGTADLDAEDQGCQAQAQGDNNHGIQKVGFVEGVGHDAPTIWKSKEGQAALFSL